MLSLTKFLNPFNKSHVVPGLLEMIFLQCLTLDVTANCTCEIHCLVLDGFDLNTVHKLSNKEKKYGQNPDSNPGLLGTKQECYLCATSSLIIRTGWPQSQLYLVSFDYNFTFLSLSHQTIKKFLRLNSCRNRCLQCCLACFFCICDH